MGLDQSLLRQIPGGDDLLAWFSRAPSFHDAEVLSVTLERERERCRIAIHAFQMTSALDDRGYFITDKHVVVQFELERVSALTFSDFNHQNVIDGLTLTRNANGEYSLELEPCYGFWGSITAAELRIVLVPGIPPGSIYQRKDGDRT